MDRRQWLYILLTTARTWRQKLPHHRQIWLFTLVLLLIILVPGIQPRSFRPPAAEKPLTGGWPVEEVNLLARLVAAEAKDEPYIGKVAVAAVVLNRTRHPDFPSTIPGVIFEPWAFESVMNGSFWEVTVEEPDYRASQDALSDWDPSGGALYFFNPATATSPWIWTRPQITVIGRHIFAL
ncbi:cell wall hydrolase [Moorellaceae bacterium AZ2]